MIIFLEKQSQRVELYGSIKAMYDAEKELIKVSINTIYQTRLKKPYEDEMCVITKKEVVRSKNK